MDDKENATHTGTAAQEEPLDPELEKDIEQTLDVLFEILQHHRLGIMEMLRSDDAEEMFETMLLNALALVRSRHAPIDREEMTSLLREYLNTCEKYKLKNLGMSKEDYVVKVEQEELDELNERLTFYAKTGLPPGFFYLHKKAKLWTDAPPADEKEDEEFNIKPDPELTAKRDQEHNEYYKEIKEMFENPTEHEKEILRRVFAKSLKRHHIMDPDREQIPFLSTIGDGAINKRVELYDKINSSPEFTLHSSWITLYSEPVQNGEKADISQRFVEADGISVPLKKQWFTVHDLVDLYHIDKSNDLSEENTRYISDIHIPFESKSAFKKVDACRHKLATFTWEPRFCVDIVEYLTAPLNAIRPGKFSLVDLPAYLTHYPWKADETNYYIQTTKLSALTGLAGSLWVLSSQIKRFRQNPTFQRFAPILFTLPLGIPAIGFASSYFYSFFMKGWKYDSLSEIKLRLQTFHNQQYVKEWMERDAIVRYPEGYKHVRPFLFRLADRDLNAVKRPIFKTYEEFAESFDFLKDNRYLNIMNYYVGMRARFEMDNAPLHKYREVYEEWVDKVGNKDKEAVDERLKAWKAGLLSQHNPRPHDPMPVDDTPRWYHRLFSLFSSSSSTNPSNTTPVATPTPNPNTTTTTPAS